MVNKPRLLINSLEKKILSTLKKYGMIFHGDSILVAFSGGPDSVFLLHFLKKFETHLHISVSAVHVNHLLRGDAAEHDEKFCHALCEKLNIPLYIVRENVSEIAKKRQISVEEAGHIIRYMHFRRILAGEKITKLATAHHLNDNSETMLLNIFKGTGLQGLSGIAPVLDGNVIRPLIEIEKKDILHFLQKNKCTFCIDATNQSDVHQRNYIRNQVLPAIKENLNPLIDYALYKLSALSRDISDYAEKHISEHYSSVCSRGNGGVYIRIEKLKWHHPFLRKEIIRKVLSEEMNYASSFKDMESIFLLLENQKGKEITLKDSVHIIRDNESLFVSRRKRNYYLLSLVTSLSEKEPR